MDAKRCLARVHLSAHPTRLCGGHFCIRSTGAFIASLYPRWRDGRPLRQTKVVGVCSIHSDGRVGVAWHFHHRPLPDLCTFSRTTLRWNRQCMQCPCLLCSTSKPRTPGRLRRFHQSKFGFHQWVESYWAHLGGAHDELGRYCRTSIHLQRNHISVRYVGRSAYQNPRNASSQRTRPSIIHRRIPHCSRQKDHRKDVALYELVLTALLAVCWTIPRSCRLGIWH